MCQFLLPSYDGDFAVCMHIVLLSKYFLVTVLPSISPPDLNINPWLDYYTQCVLQMYKQKL